MGSFSYKAYDSEGGEVHGKIDAQNLDNARALLQGQKLMVASVSEDNGYGINAGFFSNTRVSAQELEYLTSELSLLLNSGVTIDRGLAVMRRSPTSQAQGKLEDRL
jgi:general secretion pathway protein F